MQTDWQEFLALQGAEFEDDRVKHFGNPERELSVVLSGNIICDLSHYALLAISGEDANAFLHSQFINDIDELDENHSQLNGYCNPKGRLIANFRVFKRDDTTFLRFPRELTETMIKRLNMYKMRSKVSIDDVSDSFVRIGYSGKTADSQLADILDAMPGEINEAVYCNNLTVIRVPGITPSYELYSDESSIQDIWNKLDVQGAPVGPESWKLIEILAGLPHITAATSEEFVPQMINYQAIDGLSFKKGCYPGQEIVARMHYLGKLKKRMYLGRVKTDNAAEINQELFSHKDKASSKTGNIVNVAKHPDGDYAVLAVIQISDADSSEILLGKANGPKLKIVDLPYTVDLKEV